MTYDQIRYPEHYTKGTIQPVEVIADWQLDHFLGSVIKYIARSKYKGNEIQDLKKAAQYLKMEIELLEKGKLHESIQETYEK